MAVSHHRALSCPDFPLYGFPYSDRSTRRTKEFNSTPLYHKNIIFCKSSNKKALLAVKTLMFDCFYGIIPPNKGFSTELPLTRTLLQYGDRKMDFHKNFVLFVGALLLI